MMHSCTLHLAREHGPPESWDPRETEQSSTQEDMGKTIQDETRWDKATINTVMEQADQHFDATRHSQNNSDPINMDINIHQRTSAMSVCLHCSHSSFWLGPIQAKHDPGAFSSSGRDCKAAISWGVTHDWQSCQGVFNTFQYEVPTWAKIEQLAQQLAQRYAMRWAKLFQRDQMRRHKILCIRGSSWHRHFAFWWGMVRNSQFPNRTANVGLAQLGKMPSIGHVKASAKIGNNEKSGTRESYANFKEKTNLDILRLLHNVPDPASASPLPA